MFPLPRNPEEAPFLRASAESIRLRRLSRCLRSFSRHFVLRSELDAALARIDKMQADIRRLESRS